MGYISVWPELPDRYFLPSDPIGNPEEMWHLVANYLRFTSILCVHIVYSTLPA